MQWCACKVWKVSLRELRRKLRAKGRRPSHGKMLVCYPPPNSNAKNNPKKKMLRETSTEGRSPWKLVSLALASHSKLRDLHTIRCSRLSGSGKKSNVLVVKSSIQFRGKRACAEALDDCFCAAILVAVPRHFVSHVSFWRHAKNSHVRKKDMLVLILFMIGMMPTRLAWCPSFQCITHASPAHHLRLEACPFVGCKPQAAISWFYGLHLRFVWTGRLSCSQVGHNVALCRSGVRAEDAK